jgi:hypothetical protein
MKVFKLNREVQKSVIIKGNVINEYWSYNIINIEEKHADIILITKEMSQNLTSVIYPIHYINMTMLNKQWC